MSHSTNYTDTGPTTGFYQGRDAERERIIKLLIEEGVFCNGHWNHECPNADNCPLVINGGWHGPSPCEWDFTGGNSCQQVIALIKEV